MRRLIAVFIVLLLGITGIPCTDAFASSGHKCGNDLTWNLEERMII